MEKSLIGQIQTMLVIHIPIGNRVSMLLYYMMVQNGCNGHPMLFPWIRKVLSRPGISKNGTPPPTKLNLYMVWTPDKAQLLTGMDLIQDIILKKGLTPPMMPSISIRRLPGVLF